MFHINCNTTNLKPNEIGLVDSIKNLTDEEQMQIVQERGLSNVRDIMTSNFAQMQTMETIEKEDYFASAIADMYDWGSLNIEEISVTERNELIQKLKQSNCVSIYEKLKEAGIENKDIPTAVINMASKGRLNEILQSENYVEQIQENIGEITQNLSIEQIERYLGYYDVKGTGIELRDYQQDAVDKAEEIYKEKRYASIILPTGGGKTYVALTEMLQCGKTAEEIAIEENQIELGKIGYKTNNKRMLYLAPSNEILEQTKDRIIENIRGKVGTTGKSKDEIIAEVFPNLEFATYQSLITKAGKETLKKQYDFIILDELHRTGAEKWEKALDKLLENQPEETKVLGITATPTRDADDRNMSDEIAKKLGYTDEEIKAEKHIAAKIELKEAIQLGMVVNPKIVSFEYQVLIDGRMKNLAEQINEIEDENERKKKLEQYDRLRKNLEKAKGIPKILQENLKKGGKYIVFIPVGGNEEGKDSIDKVKELEKQISEYLKNSGIEPEYYSMLSAYSDKENERQLEGFESEKSDKTKFMIVMNKLNEGVHVEGVNGILWFRPLDENSKILYKQQIGRVITSVDPDNPPKDEDRPTVMDFANNTERVDIDKEIKNNNRKNDLELLKIVVDWVKSHGDNLPQVTSTSNQERRYAATLYRIQQKYIEYRNGIDIDNEGITEDERNNIENIIAKGEEIELWDRELESITKEECDKLLEVDSFELKGNLHDLVELEKEVERLPKINTIDEFIEKLERLQEIGVDVSKITRGDTILKLVRKTLKEPEEILIQRIKEIGLKTDDDIGGKLNYIKWIYNKSQRGEDTGGRTIATEAQVKKLKEMRVWEKNRVDNIIKDFEKLESIGVDVSKIIMGDTTILELVGGTLEESEEVLIRKIKEIGLNPNENIGKKLSNIKTIYNKSQRGEDKGGRTIATEAQVKRLKEMGVWEKEKKNTIDEFIEKLEKLQEIGVDVSKIAARDTILKLVGRTLDEPEEVLIQKIKEIGLKPCDNISSKLSDIKYIYNKSQRGEDTGEKTIATEAQVKKLKEMGVWEKNIVDNLIKDFEKLESIGVDVLKIKTTDTILSLVQNTFDESKEILIKKIKEIGLKPDDNIGNKLNSIRKTYNKSQRGEDTEGQTIATEAQVKKLKEMGVWEKNIVDNLIKDFEKLESIGVDVSKIGAKDTILKLVGRSLDEPEEILIKKIKEIGLRPDDNIGNKLNNIRKNYNKSQRGEDTGGQTIATEEQVQKIRSFGIKIGKEITGQSIGQASYTATVQECDEAQADLNKLIQEQQEITQKD